MYFLNSMKESHEEDFEEWLDKACSGKKRETSRLKDMKEGLLAAYNNYDAIIKNSSSSPEPSTYLNEKKFLKGFYTSSPKDLRTLILNRRYNHNLKVCPYCGCPESPNTLDHFMPKDVWPELVLYPNNLVPQCSICGSIKGDRYYCEDTKSVRYIHPIYYDLLSFTRFSVEISLNEIEGTILPKFAVSIFLSQECAEEDKRWLRKHFDELKVKERAATHCLRAFNLLKLECAAKCFPLKTFLTLKLDRYDPIEGDWESAMLKCIINNESVLEYLKELMPPSTDSVDATQNEERVLLIA